MRSMPPDDLRQNFEPSEDVISKRNAILAVAAAIPGLSEKVLCGWAFKKFGMPVEIVPLVHAFAEGKIQAIEVIDAWIEIGGAPKRN